MLMKNKYIVFQCANYSIFIEQRSLLSKFFQIFFSFIYFFCNFSTIFSKFIRPYWGVAFFKFF
ncbi:MAG: hypothetical protein RL757_2908 [Bacteroidota bacterium]|jgi:hypothetical protein